MKDISKKSRNNHDAVEDINEVLLSINTEMNPSIDIFFADLLDALDERQKAYAKGLYGDLKSGDFSSNWPLIQLELCHYYSALKDQLNKKWRTWELITYREHFEELGDLEAMEQYVKNLPG